MGIKISGTVGGSVGAAHIGAGGGLYFDKDGLHIEGFEDVGLGLGEKLGIEITFPLKLH